MASYTALLKLTQPDLGATGWGTTVNSGVTALVEQAVAGAVSVAVTTVGPNTLSAIASGASSDARNQFLILTGTLSGPATLTVPAAPGATSSKLYFIKNSAGDAVTVETSGGTSVSVPNGKSMMLKVTTAGVEEAMTHAASLTLGTALPATSGGTGQSSYTIGDLLYASSTTALTKLAAAAVGNVLRAKGTGTAPAWEKADLTADVTGVLPVANGGTGAATLAANNVLLGNGTGALQAVAPSTAQNILRSNGTTWQSSPQLITATAVFVSGTAVDFTAIPAGVKRITILLSGVSTNGSSPVTVQIGDSGGIETNSYGGGVWGTNNSTTGFSYTATAFYLDPNAGDSSISRIGTAILENIDGNIWILNSNLTTIGGIAVGAGAKTLSGTLDRIRLTTIGGTDTFDAGTVNIMYE